MYFSIIINQSGIAISDQINFNPLCLELTADVPDTWNIAGRLYIYKNSGSHKLLIESDLLYFGFTHISLITESNYSVMFKPVRYLEGYSLKIGSD